MISWHIMMYHDISWHFCHTIKKIICVAKARTYGIFVAKFYDYSLIDSSLWSADFSDSAASACLIAVLQNLLTTRPVPVLQPKVFVNTRPKPVPKWKTATRQPSVRPWWIPHVCLPQHSRLCQLCVGWFLPTSTYELVPVPFPKVLEHFYNSLRSYTHGLNTCDFS